MAKTFDYYENLAVQMIKDDEERDEMFQAMEDMYHLKFDFPPGMIKTDWIRKIKTSDPFDALNTFARVFSTVAPKLSYQPMQPFAGNPGAKAANDRREKCLKATLLQANRRGKSKVIQDILLSAARNATVSVQVLDLEFQKGMSKNRLKAARRYGRFAVQVENPRFVHSRFSNWMLECVLTAKVMKTQEVIDFWGDMADEVKKQYETDDTHASTMYTTIYDYWDLEVHGVWCYVCENAVLTQAGDNPIMILDPTTDEARHKMNWIPWVIKVGGNNLDSDPEDQCVPLLYGVYKTGSWATQNILYSAAASEVIAHIGGPAYTVEGAQADKVEIDYDDPAQMLKNPPGTTTKNLQKPQIDQNAMAIVDRSRSEIEKTTIARILQSGDFPSAAAYATLNLAQQSAVKSVMPFKVLAENALAEVCTQMLYWIDHTRKPLTSYGTGKDDLGTNYTIAKGDFDVDNIYIEVELTPDVPTDRQSRINAAAQAVRELGMSREAGLEDAGIEDPSQELERRTFEDLLMAEIQNAIAKKQAALQLQVQQAQMQIQMEAQQMQQEQMAAAQGLQSGAPVPGQAVPEGGNMAQGGNPGIPGVSGSAFNPSQGGQIPAQVSPNSTREMQTGVSRSGTPNAAGKP